MKCGFQGVPWPGNTLYLNCLYHKQRWTLQDLDCYSEGTGPTSGKLAKFSDLSEPKFTGKVRKGRHGKSHTHICVCVCLCVCIFMNLQSLLKV